MLKAINKNKNKMFVADDSILMIFILSMKMIHENSREMREINQQLVDAIFVSTIDRLAINQQIV